VYLSRSSVKSCFDVLTRARRITSRGIPRSTAITGQFHPSSANRPRPHRPPPQPESAIGGWRTWLEAREPDGRSPRGPGQRTQCHRLRASRGTHPRTVLRSTGDLLGHWSGTRAGGALIPSTLDSKLAPSGAQVVSLFCRHFSYNLPGGRSWRQQKQGAIDRIFATVDSYAPNSSASFVGHSAFSTLELEEKNSA
jgi:hypothetical protein